MEPLVERRTLNQLDHLKLSNFIEFAGLAPSD